jgi:hypothetical protein
MSNVFFFFFFNCAFCEITWINVLKWDRPQMTIWRMRIACWIPRATNKHSGCGAFPLQQCGCTNVPQCYAIRTLPPCFVSVYFRCRVCLHCLQRTAVFRNLKLLMWLEILLECELMLCGPNTFMNEVYSFIDFTENVYSKKNFEKESYFLISFCNCLCFYKPVCSVTCLHRSVVYGSGV